MRPRARTPVLLVVAAGVAAVGIGAASSAGGGSGIRGRVIPCGLVHERPAPCATSAAGATVVIRRAGGRTAAAVVRAGGDGRFRVAVAPGSYVVEARPKGAARQAHPPTVGAEVPEHGWVTVVVPAGRIAPPTVRLTGRG
jgi:hypothetical protein